MRHTISSTTALIITLLVALPAFPEAASAQGERPRISNRVAVIVDASGSYRDRREEAVERAVALLDGLATQHIDRWEPAADRIAVISLDAMPDILWEGSLRDLQELDRRSWVDRFNARRDFQRCTDVGTAFRMAVRHVQSGEGPADKYIFAFTDLVDEPPTTSLRRCRRPSRPSVPDDAFPWEQLRDVSASVFWVPPEQTLAWRRAVAEQGMDSTFSVYSDSESGEITIAPPPRPTVVVTEAERVDRRAEVAEAAGSLGRYALYAIAGLLGLVVLLGLVGLMVRLVRGGSRRRPGPHPLPRAPRAGGPRPPLAAPRPGAVRPQPHRPAPPRSNGHA